MSARKASSCVTGKLRRAVAVGILPGRRPGRERRVLGPLPRSPGGRSRAAGRAAIMASMEGTISYDLVMDDSMSFVEGTFRLGSDDWEVFVVSKGPVSRPEWRACTWDSGVT